MRGSTVYVQLCEFCLHSLFFRYNNSNSYTMNPSANYNQQQQQYYNYYYQQQYSAAPQVQGATGVGYPATPNSGGASQHAQQYSNGSTEQQYQTDTSGRYSPSQILEDPLPHAQGDEKTSAPVTAGNLKEPDKTAAEETNIQEVDMEMENDEEASSSQVSKGVPPSKDEAKEKAAAGKEVPNDTNALPPSSQSDSTNHVSATPQSQLTTTVSSSDSGTSWSSNAPNQPSTGAADNQQLQQQQQQQWYAPPAPQQQGGVANWGGAQAGWPGNYATGNWQQQGGGWPQQQQQQQQQYQGYNQPQWGGGAGGGWNQWGGQGGGGGGGQWGQWPAQQQQQQLQQQQQPGMEAWAGQQYNMYQGYNYHQGESCWACEA